ncbi:phage terminase small subunit P27 family [Sutcliffiella horikoshii]|uniref:phage terminase small subunit P27 family n=1 Tax=Sutcliffiella horikoshii TaxID=79883 RepID=UPI00203E56DC|nr:phage terminase small subunit P27 family [Sutcliffiella horikoshii]MCM3616687.1 phage terminase small subunit P27 family [Sutcliffiella horikoshii]
MARPRQPIDLIVHKGKKNLTKEEIANRKAQEVKAPNDKVKPPAYLPRDLKREFNKIANELVSIGIMTNLDIDALARFLIAKKLYLEVTSRLLDNPELALSDKDIITTQDKLFKQSRVAANDLGLSISSRCKLVVPKKEDNKPKNKFEKFAK